MGPWYRSAFRNMRTDSSVPQPPSVSGPVGADNSTTRAGQTAAAQASALRGARSRAQVSEEREPDMFDTLPASARQQLAGGYAAGGFEGVRNAVGAADWYDLPEHVRRSLLSRMTGGV